jgi:hypothetical protein
MDFSKQELVVVPSLAIGQTRAVTAEKKRQLGNSRKWIITSSVSGAVRVEARSGSSIAVFYPPHPQCGFRAYASFALQRARPTSGMAWPVAKQ